MTANGSLRSMLVTRIPVHLRNQANSQSRPRTQNVSSRPTRSSECHFLYISACYIVWIRELKSRGNKENKL
jgi:hypothetical protein